VPKEITVNNTKQFDCHIFKDLCRQMGIEVAFTSVYHPQSNEAVEKVNALIFTATKKIQENQPKDKWAEELPRAVWSHNTFICRATKFTPFKLLYRGEPVTPEEIMLHSVRTKTNARYSPSEALISTDPMVKGGGDTSRLTIYRIKKFSTTSLVHGAEYHFKTKTSVATPELFCRCSKQLRVVVPFLLTKGTTITCHKEQ
jgi:hypothetical protein